MRPDVSILPGLDSNQQPRDDVLLCYAGWPPRLVASAAMVADGPEWVVVGFGQANGFQTVTSDVRQALVDLAGRERAR